MKSLALLASTLLTGCAALAPMSAPIELTHISHLTQHFGDRTDFGYDSINVGLKWTPAPGLSVKLEEGIGLDNQVRFNTRYYGNQPAYGALLGPREVFTGSISYEIPLR